LCSRRLAPCGSLLSFLPSREIAISIVWRACAQVLRERGMFDRPILARCALCPGKKRVLMPLTEALHAATMSALEGNPADYAFLHFERFRCGDGRAPCTQAGCVRQVLPAENWKEPKGVRDRRERAPVMLGQWLSQEARR
jgi:hypothetical protein